MSILLGNLIEQKACQYLRQQGLKLITSNYRCRVGEIDLIMNDGELIVFVEVRARSSTKFGGAIESITHLKQQKIMKTALHYLTTHRLMDKHPTRFDVLIAEGNPFSLKWIPNAFDAHF